MDEFSHVDVARTVSFEQGSCKVRDFGQKLFQLFNPFFFYTQSIILLSFRTVILHIQIQLIKPKMCTQIKPISSSTSLLLQLIESRLFDISHYCI